MSLFASLGQGDIWALSGISFASPINDLLEKGGFTLDQLLEEDELIQEVKSKNDKLIEFLTTEESIDRLLDYIIRPAVPVESSIRAYKYPYMSCEVICCEIPEMLQRLVIESEGKHVKKLFSFLSTEGKLDYYLAGYFEKILEMLFRRMTMPMMKFFNDSGSALLSQFLDHMDNYSIMQIVQRLMLPHIPFSNLGEGDHIFSDEDREQQQCNWSYQLESCTMLFDRMFDDTDVDIPLHISDLLITVLQLSPPETFVIQFLCKDECVKKLLDAAVAEDADMINPGDEFSAKGSISLAAISVLESLSSRLFESSVPYDSNQSTDEDYPVDQIQQVKQSIGNICSVLVPYIEKINDTLTMYIRANPCSSFTNQSKSSSPRLGHRGLQMVKLIESVVRLGSPEVDSKMCSSGVFRTCLQLFFRFVNNSLLHLSIQRIILTIIEGDSARSNLQQHLLEDCKLVDMIMEKMRFYHRRREEEKTVENFESITEEEKNAPIKAQHSSISGNLVLIAQALSFALDPDGENDKEQQAEIANGSATPKPTPTNLGGSSTTDSDADSQSFGNSVQETHHLRSVDVEAKAELGDTSSEKANNLRYLILNRELLVDWDGFVDDLLKSVLNHQIVGSYQSPTSLGALSTSQDDPLKLGVDIDLFHLESGSGSMDEDDDEDIIVGPNPSVSWARKQNEIPEHDPFDDAVPITVEGDIRDPFVSACSENNSNDVGFADFASFGASNVSGASFESSFHDEDASGSFADFSDFSAAVSSEVNAGLANISLDDANNDVKNPID